MPSAQPAPTNENPNRDPSLAPDTGRSLRWRSDVGWTPRSARRGCAPVGVFRLIRMLIIVLAVAAAGCQFDVSANLGQRPTFDERQLGEQIAAGLSAQLGGAFDVECPPDQPVRSGTEFECRATDELGRVGIIAVVAVNDDGDVEWELTEVLPGGDAPDAAQDSRPAPDSSAQLGAQRPEAVPSDWVLFAESDAGFLLWHPSDWAVERAEGTSVFSGPMGTDAYRTTINVQILTTSVAGGMYVDEDDLYVDLVDQITSAGGTIFWEDDDVLELASGARRALAFQAVWEAGGESFMQLAIVLARDEATLAQISYTAPVELYEDSLDLAITIIESFDVIF